MKTFFLNLKKLYSKIFFCVYVCTFDECAMCINIWRKPEAGFRCTEAEVKGDCIPVCILMCWVPAQECCRVYAVRGQPQVSVLAFDLKWSLITQLAHTGQGSCEFPRLSPPKLHRSTGLHKHTECGTMWGLGLWAPVLTPGCETLYH